MAKPQIYLTPSPVLRHIVSEGARKQGVTISEFIKTALERHLIDKILDIETMIDRGELILENDVITFAPGVEDEINSEFELDVSLNGNGKAH